MSEKHEHFDKLHEELMDLLGAIYNHNDPSLALARFDIMESFGYQVKYVEDEPPDDVH